MKLNSFWKIIYVSWNYCYDTWISRNKSITNKSSSPYEYKHSMQQIHVIQLKYLSKSKITRDKLIFHYEINQRTSNQIFWLWLRKVKWTKEHTFNRKTHNMNYFDTTTDYNIPSNKSRRLKKTLSSFKSIDQFENVSLKSMNSTFIDIYSQV